MFSVDVGNSLCPFNHQEHLTFLMDDIFLSCPFPGFLSCPIYVSTICWYSNLLVLQSGMHGASLMTMSVRLLRMMLQFQNMFHYTGQYRFLRNSTKRWRQLLQNLSMSQLLQMVIPSRSSMTLVRCFPKLVHF